MTPEKEAQQGAPARQFHFSPPGVLRDEEMEALRRINRNLPALVGRATASMLPEPLEAEVQELDQGGWDRALSEASDSPVGCLFSAQPQGHRGMLTTERGLAAACVGSALGQQRAGGEPKRLTGLETRIFTRLAENVVEVLPRVWRDMGRFEVELGKYLDDPRGASPLSSDRNFVHFILSVRCGRTEAPLTLSFPSPPLRRLVAPEMEGEEERDGEAGGRARAGVHRTPLEVRAVLGRAELKPEELMGLEEGDVVMLNTTPEDLLDIEVEKAGKLLGMPAVYRGRKAVKLKGKQED